MLLQERFETPIEYDIRVHLRDIHQKDLVIRIPEEWLEKERAKIMIEHIKQEKQVFYDHTTAEFASD